MGLLCLALPILFSHPVDKRADGVAFTYAPKALPFPAIPAYTNAATLYPITERLNREILIVENLAPGTYTLVVACRNGARESLSPAVAHVKDFKVIAGCRL